MKIVYVAKHDSGFNDDEGAILHGLQSLGHEVDLVQQNALDTSIDGTQYDFMLLHHFDRPERLQHIKVPKVFWFFDLVNYPDDRTLIPRNTRRKFLIKQLTKACDLGLMSDGDWVRQDTSGKLVEFKQGADQRIVGAHEPCRGNFHIPILFMGSAKGGQGRESFVKFLKDEYGTKFVQVRKVYREALAKVIASSLMVVAPDHPITDNYWSNRVYMALGFGALLLHPRVKSLENQFRDCQHIIYYDTRKDLEDTIGMILANPASVNGVGWDWMKSSAVETIKKNHTYQHRCRDLIELVKERIL
jgi:hypothetical protein